VRVQQLSMVLYWWRIHKKPMFLNINHIPSKVSMRDPKRGKALV
jgi:hypothetical protein